MSKIIVSDGVDFEIVRQDRAYLGTTTTVFAVDGETGAVTIQGKEITGDQNVSGNLDVTGDAQVDGALTVTGDIIVDDLTVGDDLTVTGDIINAALSAKIAGTPTLAVGALIGDARIVTITLKDFAGTTLAAAAKATVWLSDTAGAAPTANVTGLTTTISTGLILKAHTANVLFDVVSSAGGVIGVTVTDTNGTETRFVNVAIGNVVASSAAVVTT